MKKLIIIPLLALSLAACGTPKVDSKRPVDYKTPTATATHTIKVGDKCKKSGAKLTVNGQKLVCKKVGKYGTRKWYKA